MEMSKTRAEKIARHLIQPVFVVAAGDGTGAGRGGDASRTYGFKQAVADGRYTIRSVGRYHDAVNRRREELAETVDSLMSGEAQEWQTEDFKW